MFMISLALTLFCVVEVWRFYHIHNEYGVLNNNRICRALRQSKIQSLSCQIAFYMYIGFLTKTSTKSMWTGYSAFSLKFNAICLSRMRYFVRDALDFPQRLEAVVLTHYLLDIPSTVGWRRLPACAFVHNVYFHAWNTLCHCAVFFAERFKLCTFNC